jgi:hypothetical protein
MKEKHILIALALFGACCAAHCAVELPMATATVKVVDDEKRPVEGAKVLIGFSIPYNAWSHGKIKYTDNYEGLSDKDGKFYAKGGCKGDLAYIVKKEGYYDFGPVRYDYKGGLNAVKTGWVPENPELTAVLKEIINPVSMYVRKVTIQVPEMGKPVGFDLQVNDWVAPHGSGIHPDFIFQASRRWVNHGDYSSNVAIAFHGSTDGIQMTRKDIASKSYLRTPQIAPENGYEATWSFKREVNQAKGHYIGFFDLPDTNERDDYIFRVRSKIDDRGRIMAANYGKITKGILAGGEAGEKMWIEFTYYYNPDPQSRSLEFDPKQNLAKDQKYNYSP